MVDFWESYKDEMKILVLTLLYHFGFLLHIFPHCKTSVNGNAETSVDPHLFAVRDERC